MKAFFDKLITIKANDFYMQLNKALIDQEGLFIVTANPETFMTGMRDQKFRELLEDDRTSIVPDGIGIVKVSNMIGYSVKERIPGIEIAEKLLEYANSQQKKLALFGAKPEVMNELTEKLKVQYPNIQLVKAIDGYVKDKDQSMDEIAALKPDIVMVAMGIPAQEQLLYRHIDQFPQSILVGVGGSFDVISGMKKRAPNIFIKCNLEWLYRIIREPARLGRFYNNNIKFIRMAKKIRK